MDAKIYPLDLNYIVRVVNYVRPDDSYSCQKYRFIEGQQPTLPSPIQKISSVLNEEKFESDVVMIQLYKNMNSYLEFVKEAVFKIKESKQLIFIDFSHDCKYFSILEAQKKEDYIYLFEVGEGEPEQALMTLLENIENRNCRTLTQKDSIDIQTRLIWSENSHHIAWLNETTFTV